MKQLIVQTGYEGRGWEDISFTIRSPVMTTAQDMRKLADLVNSLEVGGRVIIRRGDDYPDMPNTQTLHNTQTTSNKGYHDDTSLRVKGALLGAALLLGAIIGGVILAAIGSVFTT